MSLAKQKGHTDITELLRKREVKEDDAENDTTDTPQDPNQEDS